MIRWTLNMPVALFFIDDAYTLAKLHCDEIFEIQEEWGVDFDFYTSQESEITDEDREEITDKNRAIIGLRSVAETLKFIYPPQIIDRDTGESVKDRKRRGIQKAIGALKEGVRCFLEIGGFVFMKEWEDGGWFNGG